ncbi:TIGR00341 family protein [Rhodococcus spongiicola]|uniref:TIGR00341 family protein n=1 Tax=Rhodococcus spongiicola TaxID=2487352 RepID=A0A438B139_9NOCA|nr:TIGR00341 family protein [Rhodococcus spongiicola]RVW04674.1 TIGR00341 family protein [Rhodococcus spongiicola]
MGVLVPASQRRTPEELADGLDLAVGDASAKRSAFWTKLVLSGVIAVAGVIGDSTATVIGAMIVAPLSTPILGIGLGITTGAAGLIGRSVLTVVAGVAVVTALGFVFAQFLPNPLNVLTNSQVLGRTSPTLMDLLAALATGLVGAIAVTRRDVGDVLPGVAIAISLVPPLAVIGVCLGSGAPGLAMGAGVLFASNVLAMIITSTLVFVSAGYARAAGKFRTRRGYAYLVLAVALVVVAVPMIVNSMSSIWTEQISTAARQWIGDVPGAVVTDVTLHGNTATVSILSPELLPPLTELQDTVDGLLPWSPDVVVLHTVGGRITGTG